MGTRCEIKNINSIRHIINAIEYEAQRQIEIIESGGKIDQETRLYDPDKNETRTMRSKEDAHDYRYFPDPDLYPLVFTQEYVPEQTGRLGYTVRISPNHCDDPLTRPCSTYMRWAGS